MYDMITNKNARKTPSSHYEFVIALHPLLMKHFIVDSFFNASKTNPMFYKKRNSDHVKVYIL